MNKKKFVVVINCQGQPFYYFYKTLFGALFGYARLYKEGKRYGWRTTLKESRYLERDIKSYEIKRL